MEKINVDPDSFAGAGAAIVVVVVCVAVAARPGGMINEDFLRAKLLDSLLPRERRALREAIELVRGNPDIVKGSLGIAHTELGPNFMGNLEIVAKVLD
ncbi:MAG: hypothetical protein P9L99_20620 [Candidatus Lernaella stagnicola]|nr:hypothetical protein [Candidatus Lernaella stagnicola]